MKERKLHHVWKLSHVSILVDVLHGQDAFVVVGEIYFSLDPLLGLLATVADGCLLIGIFWNLHISYISTGPDKLRRDPRIIGILFC